MNKIPTTTRGSALIDAHMLRRSQEVPLWDCRKRAAYTYKVATIRLLLRSSSDTGWAGANERLLTTVLLGAPRRPHDWQRAPYYGITGSERQSPRSWYRLRPVQR